MEVFYLVLIVSNNLYGGITNIPTPYKTEAACQVAGDTFVNFLDTEKRQLSWSAADVKKFGDYVCLPAEI